MIAISTLRDILTPTHVLCLDAYGVVYNANGPFLPAISLIHHAQSMGIPVYICTNNATQSPQQIAAACYQFGVTIPVAAIISSGCACYELPQIRTMLHNRLVYVYGYEGSQYYVVTAGAQVVASPNKAQVIVMASSLNVHNHRIYRACATHLQRNPNVSVLCINPDHYVHVGDYEMPVMGYYAHYLERQCNQSFIWVGKPHSIYSQLVAARIESDGYSPRNILFCDDNPQNVIQLTRDLMCEGCVITDTGIYGRVSHSANQASRLYTMPACQ